MLSKGLATPCRADPYINFLHVVYCSMINITLLCDLTQYSYAAATYKTALWSSHTNYNIIVKKL